MLETARDSKSPYSGLKVTARTFLDISVPCQGIFIPGITSTAELIPPEESVPRNGVPTTMNVLRFGLWRAGTTKRVVVPAHQARNRFLSSIKRSTNTGSFFPFNSEAHTALLKRKLLRWNIKSRVHTFTILQKGKAPKISGTFYNSLNFFPYKILHACC